MVAVAALNEKQRDRAGTVELATELPGRTSTRRSTRPTAMRGSRSCPCSRASTRRTRAIVWSSAAASCGGAWNAREAGRRGRARRRCARPGRRRALDGVVGGVAPGVQGRASPSGFVDLQVNGFGGVDFSSADADGYRRAGEALLATGVTAFQPTLITAPEDDLVAALGEIPNDGIGPRVLGAHLEGPFISPHALGARGLRSARPTIASSSSACLRRARWRT